MGTTIDYEKINKFLPQSLRNFVGATNRVSRQNYQEFLTMYSGIELRAIMNNLVAAEYASGYSQFNLTYMRSGVPPKLLDIKVSKTVGKVGYQIKNEGEAELEEKFDSNYFSNMLYKAMEQAAQTGRSVMVVYGNYDNNEAHLECYNLFRHKLVLGHKKEVKEAHLYITRIDGTKAGYEYTIEEHRYYKQTKNNDGTIKFTPMQEFIVNSVVYEREDKTDAEVTRLDQIPEEIQKKYSDIKFNQARELKGFNSIGVFTINHSKTNKKFPDLDIPEAMFVDAVDNCLMVETSITDKEVEKEVGRAQIMLPEFGKAQIGTYIDPSQSGMLVREMPTTYKNPIITTYPTKSMEDSKPTNVQFDIRAEQWETSINGDICRLCASVGIGIIDYDSRLLQGGNHLTDDEVNRMTDITANTVKAFRNLNTYEINKCLECVCILLGINTPAAIMWDMASILNPTRNTDLVIKKLQAGLISRKKAIAQANPEMTPSEIEDMIKQIDAEKDSTAVPMAFDNF